MCLEAGVTVNGNFRCFFRRVWLPKIGLGRARSATVSAAVLFLHCGAHAPSPKILSIIVAAAACRCLLVVGLLAWPTMAKPNPLRFVGALSRSDRALYLAKERGRNRIEVYRE